jgi:hypothetical protein
MLAHRDSFLGVFESSMIPALGLFMTQYYKAREQGTRTGRPVPLTFICHSLTPVYRYLVLLQRSRMHRRRSPRI